ncbi:uncharacterized protein LOC142976656 [Anticarsia gemmatalis]|uniref:uncharacterized protein LOC142976656 n=1 Tax=Anticarsia gemmatalis TaxID=129554 RepID=UPI003F769A70
MQNIIIVSAILACAAAAPGYLYAAEPAVYHTVPLTSKSTYTQSSQVVDHGSTFVHTPVVHAPVVHAPVVHTAVVPVAQSKTTITKADQVVNHGGSAVLHPVHAYDVMPVHGLYHVPSKSTITKSNQVVNHGGTAVVHAVPVVHAPVVHAPVVHAPVVYHSSPLVTVKTGDSAITHHSSTVHETVPVVKSYVAVH